MTGPAGGGAARFSHHRIRVKVDWPGIARQLEPLRMTILAIALTFLLFADADVPQVNSLRPPASSNLGTFPGDEIPLFGNEASDPDSQNQAGAQDKSQNGGKSTSL